MKPRKQFSRRRPFGFMLISMMGTLTIAGILLSVTSPSIMALIESRDLDEERAACEALANEIRMSWSIPNPDYNIAQFNGGYGIAGAKKEHKFGDLKKKKWKRDQNQEDPLLKLARTRDRAPADNDDLNHQSHGGISDLFFNKRRNKRLILVGKTDEPFKQRYLVVSLMVTSHLDLTFPTPAGMVTDDDLFDSFWATTWENPKVEIPNNQWNLNTTNRDLWNEMNRGRTNASRLVVVRVVQSKYQLIVNNTNTAGQKLWVELPSKSGNTFIDETGNVGINNTSPFSTSDLPDTSPFKLGIPEGTLVNIWQGTTHTNRVKVRQFFLEKTSSITLD